MEKHPEGISPAFRESSYSSFRECYPWLTDKEAKARKISNLTSATQEQEPRGSLNSGAWAQGQGFSPTWLPGQPFLLPPAGPTDALLLQHRPATPVSCPLHHHCGFLSLDWLSKARDLGGIFFKACMSICSSKSWFVFRGRLFCEIKKLLKLL